MCVKQESVNSAFCFTATVNTVCSARSGRVNGPSDSLLSANSNSLNAFTGPISPLCCVWIFFDQTDVNVRRTGGALLMDDLLLDPLSGPLCRLSSLSSSLRSLPAPLPFLSEPFPLVTASIKIKPLIRFFVFGI